MRTQNDRLLLLLLVALMCACAGPSSPSSSSSDAKTASQPPKILTLGLGSEPGNLVSNMEGGGSNQTWVKDAVHRQLAVRTDQGEAQPDLAAELPTIAKGTWVVRPDKTMQTTTMIRPGVTWHDGVPLTARDFVFALGVQQDKELPIMAHVVSDHISSATASDEGTLVIEWSDTYPFANAVTVQDLGPLPTHILEASYRGDKAQFPSLPYWKREFLGVGPYRLAQWEPGSQLIVKATDSYFGGRPRIDTIVYRIVLNTQTLLANLLAGAIDGTQDIEFNQALVAKSQMESEGRTPVFISIPTQWRFMTVQFRDPRPRALLDGRVRHGLLQAINRPALVEALFSGQTPTSETFIPPTDPKWDWVKDAVVPDPFDQRRALETLSTVGWQHAGSGGLVDRAGQPVSIPIWTTSGDVGEREIAIIADNWRAIGIASEQYIIPISQQRDRKLRASFPAVDTTAVPAKFENTLPRFSSRGCPTEQNSWTGNNRGCYQNPDLDRLTDALQTAIDPAQQRQLYRELVAFHTQELPSLSLYFTIHARVFRQGFSGIKMSALEAQDMWNVLDWDII